MHVFLTGERGIGKTRVVRQAAELLGRPCHGFVTRFSSENRSESPLYMLPTDRSASPDGAHIIAARRDGKLAALTERFDTLGVSLLREAESHPEGLILMDECGHLEKDALLFRQEILRCLDGPIPVLGVLRKDQPWHSFIIGHPHVRVIEVTAETRDALPAIVADLLGKDFGREDGTP